MKSNEQIKDRSYSVSLCQRCKFNLRSLQNQEQNWAGETLGSVKEENIFTE